MILSFLEVTDCRLRFIAGVVYVTEDVMMLTWDSAGSSEERLIAWGADSSAASI